MDTIKSPRFWLAALAMIITAVLTVLKCISGEAAVGIIVGILGGFGVATIPGSTLKTKGPMMLVFLTALAGAVLASGCAGMTAAERRAWTQWGTQTGASISCTSWVIGCAAIKDPADRQLCVTVQTTTCKEFVKALATMPKPAP